MKKIRDLFKGNYIRLWQENYEILKKRIIPLNDIFGIIEIEDGSMYEFFQNNRRGQIF